MTGFIFQTGIDNLTTMAILTTKTTSLPHASLQADLQQLLGFHGKFHRQFVQHLPGIAIYNHTDCFLSRYSALVAVKYLVFTDF